VDLLIVELTKVIMGSLMFEEDAITNVTRLEERFIHKSIRSSLHAVVIQTIRQNTTSAELKRGGDI